MGSVIFVHGTGVRGAGYAASLSIVRGELAAEAPLLDVVECPWGEAVGVKLLGGGASVPTYASTRGPGPALDADQEVAVWTLLYDDPLFELRLLAGRRQDGGELAPGEEPPWLALDDAVARFVVSPELRALLDRSGLGPFWDDAYRDVAQSGECQDAIRSAGSGAAEQRTAIARAVVAMAIGSAAADDIPAPGGELRDAIVDAVVGALGGEEKGISSWLKDQVAGLAAQLATRYGQRKRGAITDGTYPGTGDILLYQLRGSVIRDFIEERVNRASAPITLLAHSLGGIACVDLLIMKQYPGVRRLITVGSQAPFLYEIDCLPSLRYGQALPASFPPWSNIYDPRDILSYIAEGLPQFKNRANETRDVEVDNGQPFPHSHSAYWTNPGVWKAIVSALP